MHYNQWPKLIEVQLLLIQVNCNGNVQISSQLSGKCGLKDTASILAVVKSVLHSNQTGQDGIQELIKHCLVGSTSM